MKNVTPGMLARLSQSSFILVDLVTFSLVGGLTLRYTNGDQAINYGGNTFQPIVMERTRISQKIGMEVGSCEIQLAATTLDLIGGLPWRVAVRIGLLDGAEVSIDRLPMPIGSYGDTSDGVIPYFQGRVAQVEFGFLMILVTVNDHRELANIQMPRRLYQPACVHSLFDGNCGLSRAAFADAVTVGAGATLSQVPFASGRPAGWFDQGSIVFTSGPNNTFSRSIKEYRGGIAYLMSPLPFVPAVGNTMSAAPGCDLSAATCHSKFNNLSANNRAFSGTPFVPEVETAV